jgi:hypothetical protein
MLTNWAENNVIVVNLVLVTFAHMIIRASVVSAVNFLAVFTFERQKILLSAVSHFAMLSDISKLHLIICIFVID